MSIGYAHLAIANGISSTVKALTGKTNHNHRGDTMNDEYLIEELEKKIRSLQTEVDALKERKEVWIPEKEGAWWLTPGLKPQLLCTYDSAAEVGNSFASQAAAEAAVPLRYNQ
ncbi:MAG: hypothetical protein GY819_19385, partial [Planctomycetaceae bacterium]|nr:hypothetical protein [Planctomycetaceae bacterium]